MGAKLTRSLNLVALSLIVGLILGMSPVGAHINKSVGHVFGHMKARIDREIVHESTETNSDDKKSAFANCPDEKVPIGGGFSLSGPSNQPDPPPEVAITVNEPVEAPDTGGGAYRSWFGEAAETKPTNVEWSLSVYAICANL